MTPSRTTLPPIADPGVLDERADSAGLLLALLGQQAMRRLRAAHTAERLSPRQFHLLGLLHDRGPTTQRELGALMDVDPSVLVTLLNPLEADGYLARERDPADRRRHVVNLTTTGKRQLNRALRPNATPKSRSSPASPIRSASSCGSSCSSCATSSRPAPISAQQATVRVPEAVSHRRRTAAHA